MSFPLVLGGDGLAVGDSEAATAATPAAGGSWESYRSVLQAAVADHEAAETAPLVACPNDLQPLLVGPDGILFCPWDGWRP